MKKKTDKNKIYMYTSCIMSIGGKHEAVLRIYGVAVNFKTNLNNEYVSLEFQTEKNLDRFYV